MAERAFADMTRRGLIGLASGAVLTSASRSEAQRVRRRDWSSLDAIVAGAVERLVTPGMQLSVLDAGQLVYSRGFGSANLETRTPLTPASVMRIGSLAKQFTAAAILLLQEDGRLSVDDPLSRFVPELAPAARVTLRQMLSHTSGLSIGPAAGQIEQRGTEVVEHDTPGLLAVIQARGPTLRTPPGTRWEYNNLAYRLLGIVVERAAGERPDTFYKTRLFDRARLVQTAVDYVPDIVPGRASGYERAPTAPGGFRHAPPISLAWPGGGAFIRSTTDDLCRWHHHLLGGRILRHASLAAMLTPVRLADGSLPPPRNGSDANAGPVRYGMGVALDRVEGEEAVTHTGGITGFVAELTSFPARGLTLAALANVSRTAGTPDVVREPLRLAARIALG